MTKWYEKSFGEDYLLVYKHRDAQGARCEVQKMISWLGLSQGARLLDLCCGMGRHSMALVEAGYEVTGVDLSDVLLCEAKRNDPDNLVEWLRADMRELPLHGGYEAVVNLFTSFGYFEKDEEHIKVLKEIARMLKPKGRFIIDFLNPSYTEAHLIPYSERIDVGQRIIENRRIVGGYVEKHIAICEEGHVGEKEFVVPRNYLERIKLYSYERFLAMLSEAGLQLDKVHGGYDEEIYDMESSPRMILVGTLA